jgi:hypothetical protein
MCGEQGDQIGQSFAFWVTVYFGDFLNTLKTLTIGLLFQGKSYGHINFDKKNCFGQVFHKRIWSPWWSKKAKKQWSFTKNILISKMHFRC